MHLIQFSIHDSKAEAFLPPFTAQSVGVGVRMFEQAANDPNTNFSRFAEDYTLFELGSFDCETATFTPLPTPKTHGSALIHKHTAEDREANRDLLLNDFNQGESKS